MNSENASYFETNRKTWNKKVAVHKQSEFYDLDGFKNGLSSLNSYELDALDDVNKKSLLHLQCHFGQDTLSWARMGAICTGVDISDVGIAFAKNLAEDIGVSADFVCCNVLETSTYVKSHFDIVFSSYGTIGWLPDLKPWGEMIASRLKNGGIFYIVEFHPIVWMFDYVAENPKIRYAYHRKEVIFEEYCGTYANPNSKMISKEYGWNHGLGAVVSALTKAGLYINYLNELDESPYDVLPNLVKTENGYYRTKDQMYPLLFELKATKI